MLVARYYMTFIIEKGQIEQAGHMCGHVQRYTHDFLMEGLAIEGVIRSRGLKFEAGDEVLGEGVEPNCKIPPQSPPPGDLTHAVCSPVGSGEDPLACGV